VFVVIIHGNRKPDIDIELGHVILRNLSFLLGIKDYIASNVLVGLINGDAVAVAHILLTLSQKSLHDNNFIIRMLFKVLNCTC